MVLNVSEMLERKLPQAFLNIEKLHVPVIPLIIGWSHIPNLIGPYKYDYGQFLSLCDM